MRRYPQDAEWNVPGLPLQPEGKPMNTIATRLKANETMRRACNAEIEKLGTCAVISMSPKSVLVWFFTWTLCVAGFYLVMSLAGAPGKVLKFFFE